MIELYDGNLMFIGPLNHVIQWGYEQKSNELCTATIVLPAEDDANAQIVVPASWARLYDGDRDLGFYRFSAITAEEHDPGGVITYQLQSAECTLLDSMLSGWHEIGGTGVTTQDVLSYILDQQSVARWVLGTCDFRDQYQYNFEDVTLLEAVMSLGEVLLGDYRFVFDSTVTPWEVRLEKVPDAAYCSLVYRRNMTSIRRSVDGALVTRLYGRGYGEGDNQLTIASVNGGKEYIDADTAAIARWGIREGVHVDTRQTDPATLKARMEQILAAGCSPQVSYEAEAIDLHRITGESWDDVACGVRVLVLDETLGAPVVVKVASRKKDDVDGDAGRISYVLDNSRPDTAEELNEILDRIGVHELYSQGATNMYSMQLSDNADASHPLVMRFYVPGNVLRINSCLLSWELEAFRTYATLAKSGGGAAKTSESGGGATVTLPERILKVEKVSAGPIDTDGGSADHTGYPVDRAGNAVLATGGSSEVYTDNALNADGMMTRTGNSDELDTSENGGGQTGMTGEQRTGAPQGADGAMTRTGENGEQTTGTGGGGQTGTGGSGNTGASNGDTAKSDVLETGTGGGGNTGASSGNTADSEELTTGTGGSGNTGASSGDTAKSDALDTGTGGGGNTGVSSGSTADSEELTTGTGGSGNTGASNGSTASCEELTTGTGGSGNTGASSGSTASSSVLTTGIAGGHSHNGNSHRHSAADTHRHTQGETYTTYNSAGFTTYTSAGTSTVDDHAHSVPAHSHGLNAHVHAVTGHNHSVPAHSHGLNAHQHAIPGHNHSIPAHSHGLNAHQHTITEHIHSVPAHSHGLNAHQHAIPGHNHSVPAHSHGLNDHQHTIAEHAHSIPAHSHGLNAHVHAVTGHVHEIKAHAHSVPAHSHEMGHWHLMDGHQHSISGHSHSVPAHNHPMAHYHAVSAHTHGMEHRHPMDHMHSITHEHVIPPMSFTLEAHSHSVNVPAHTHDLAYGVYEGERAGNVSLIVDGAAIPPEVIGDARELDVAVYLRKNDYGKVTRSAWHEVQFVPDGLTRITADLFFQVFIQSRGRGDY